MRFITTICLALLPLSLCSSTANDYERQQIQQRIAPTGQVRVQESTGTAASAPLPEEIKQEEATKEPGQEIYEAHCVVCHRDGVAGAPKFRDKADWAPKLAAKNIDALTASAIKGINAMPAKGACSECSDADIKAAVQYMVPRS